MPPASEAGSGSSGLLGWTCETCGDTFTTDAVDVVVCPSCGGSEVRAAAEPFL